MATVTATSMRGTGAKTLTFTTLTGTSDTFTFSTTRNPVLLIKNPTVGAISPTIDGAGGTTVSCPGVGSVDVSGGYAVGSIAADAEVAIQLNTISAYLQGTIAITSGTDLEVALLEF
jgi:hypothetical protein